MTGDTTCVPGAERETSVTLDCTLAGEVDPWGVKETRVWFGWGRSQALGEATKPPVQLANLSSEGEEEPFVKVGVPIEVRPNEAFYYQLTGEDFNVKQPEQLTGERASFLTPLVAPKVVDETSVSFVKGVSAVMFAELNPENASTEYFFEYGPGNTLEACPGVKQASCPGVGTTAAEHSSVYGKIGATFEASGLQPATTYRYRLVANNEQEVNKQLQGGEAKGPPGTFTTARAPSRARKRGLPA